MQACINGQPGAAQPGGSRNVLLGTMVLIISLPQRMAFRDHSLLRLLHRRPCHRQHSYLKEIVHEESGLDNNFHKL